MILSRANIEGFTGVIASNISDQDFDKIKNAISSSTAPVEVENSPVVIPENISIGVVSIVGDTTIVENKRKFTIKTKGATHFGTGLNPSDFYACNPDENRFYPPSDSIWIIVLKFNNGTRASIELNGKYGSFQLTGGNIVTEGTTDVVESTTSPVVVNPSTNNSFSFNTPQLNIAPLNQRIKLSNKIQFQTSAWSAGKGSGMRIQISRDGRTIYNHEVGDNQYPKEVDNPFNLSKHPDDWKNNHSTSARLILPKGTYKIEYQNSTSIDYPIVFTLIDSKDAGYFVYYQCGLKKKETLFFKQLNKGESLTTDFTLYENVPVIKQEGNVLRKAVFINFIVDGKLSLERFEVDFGNGQYQSFDQLRAISTVDDTRLRYVMEKDHSKFIEIMFYPNSKEFMVVAKNGVDVAEEHIDLSESIFDFSDNNNDGVKFPNFKMTNNSGFEMLSEFGSIMQRNENGDLVENGADPEVIIPFIDGEYKSTQSWRYDCDS